MTLTAAAVAMVVAVAVAVAWTLLQLLRQQGRLLLAQDELQARLGALERLVASTAGRAETQVGLALGATAPDFELPALSGGSRKLADYRGRQVTMVFFDPGCGFCAQLAPTLRDVLPHELVVMSRGDRQANRHLAEQHGWRGDVLIEPSWDVAAAFGVHATPTAYRIDAGGTIASRLATGVDGVVELLGLHPPLTAESLERRRESVVERARGAGIAIAPSRIQRNGLPPGVPAPDFTREDLHGNRIRLQGMRGKQVLLVFSDPGCGPCQELLPSLQKLHEANRHNGLNLVMVSRGGSEANLRKVREHGLTFPVVLQDGWEISMQYAIFATPVGYLIDERGTIAKGVAVGADAILNLLQHQEVDQAMRGLGAEH